MLFWVKLSLPRAALAALILLGLTLGLVMRFNLRLPSTGFASALPLGVLSYWVVVGIDFALMTLLRRVGGAAFDHLFADFIGTFRGLKPWHWLAAGLVAGLGEESLFRGVLVFGLAPALGPVVAILLAALLFGAAHILNRRLLPFAVWAMWQGILLGAAAWLTGSLTVAMIAHFLHDSTGFAYFAWLSRRRE